MIELITAGILGQITFDRGLLYGYNIVRQPSGGQLAIEATVEILVKPIRPVLPVLQ